MLRKIIRFLVYKEKRSSKAYINYLNKKGASIDESCWIVSPTRVLIDETRPFLLEIGKNVTITEGVKILTHGFDWSVLKVKYGRVLGSSGKVKINDNVFIGVDTIILKGVEIGKNTIIGAGSVVTNNIPKNVVAAGNPCRCICSIEDYFRKRLYYQYDEAKEIAIEFKKIYGKWPSENYFLEFYNLFMTSKQAIENENFKSKVLYGGCCLAQDTDNVPMFKNYSEFIQKVELDFIKEK